MGPDRDDHNNTHNNTLCLLVAVLLLATLRMGLAECPKVCECKWKGGKESVSCVNANFAEVPPLLDSGTQVLDLSGNGIQVVEKDAFSKAGLLNLQRVYLARCKIKQMDRDAFNRLTNLVELDLSSNQLPYVPTHIFASISELRELKLSGNPIQRVSNNAFAVVAQLVKLELSDCSIGTVESRSFRGLASLEWLKLDGNRLHTLPHSTFFPLRSLHELVLHHNPWNCTCDLRPLREWMVKKNVPYGVPPVCASPPRLQGLTWDKLDLDDYACKPGVLEGQNNAQGVQGENVTLSCRVGGIPEPRVRWLWNNRAIANTSSSASTMAHFRRDHTYVVREWGNQTEKVSNLTVRGVEVQDAGTYTCVAENKAGVAEANVTLSVLRRTAPVGSLNRLLLAGMLLAGLLLVAMCLLLGCACNIRTRQRRQMSRQDDYEKIEMNHKGPVVANHVIDARPCGERNSTAGDVSPNATSNKRPKHGDYQSVPTMDTDQTDANDAKIWLVKHELEASVTGSNPSGGSCETFPDDQRHTRPLELSLTPASDTLPSPASMATITSGKPDALSPTQNITTLSRPQVATSRGSGQHRRVVSESQSPLLPGSRSSAEGSNPSLQQPPWAIYNPCRHSSTSSMNLSGPEHPVPALRRNPSLPTSPMQHRDVLSVAHRSDDDDWYADEARGRPRGAASSLLAASSRANTYDYHAAQLEKFLEEYRNLQEQLWRMKETCDNLKTFRTSTEMMASGSAVTSPSGTDSGQAGARGLHKGTRPESTYHSAFYTQFGLSGLQRRASIEFYPK